VFWFVCGVKISYLLQPVLSQSTSVAAEDGEEEGEEERDKSRKAAEDGGLGAAHTKFTWFTTSSLHLLWSSSQPHMHGGCVA
jgi:hypothetical protein